MLTLLDGLDPERRSKTFESPAPDTDPYHRATMRSSNKQGRQGRHGEDLIATVGQGRRAVLEQEGLTATMEKI